MDRCNCGHLVQTLMDMTDIEIVQSVDYQLDEWTEHAKDYCAGSRAKVQDLFDTLKNFGLSPDDMRHLEHLSDKWILNRIGRKGPLRRNAVGDVTLNMTAMAGVLEEA
jgi:hypothetical protein